MPKSDALFECILCKEKFSSKDVAEGRFFSTGVCEKCYRKKAKLPHTISCFGKKQRRHRPGYSKKNLECTKLCPDRTVCSQFVTINH